MKLFLRIMLIIATWCGVDAVWAAEPQVTFSVSPEESGQMIYAPMGALTATDAPTGRLWFSLSMLNNGSTNLNLTSIRVTMTGLDVSIPRDVVCVPGVTKGTSLTHDEIITVPHPAPGTVTIRLYFAGNPTPRQVQRTLVPYVPATPNGQYFYPADEGDIGPNEYFSDSQAHGPGSQFWGADWKVYRVVGAGTSSVSHDSVIRAGGDYAVNEDHLGWGVPMRAVADGIVLRTSTGWINNPGAGVRALQKMAEVDGEAISDVKVTRLNGTRAASLQILSSGQIQLSVWDTANVGRQITRLGSSPLSAGELVDDIAVGMLSSTRVAGVVRLSGSNNQRVIVWDILDDGMTVTQKWAVTSTTTVREVSLAKMASNRFATGVRTSAGDLQITVWDVDGSGPHSSATGSAGVATSIATTALSATRIATSLRSDQGALKVIVWDYVSPLTALQRRGDATAENISRVAATINDGGKWVTAMRTSPGGILKLARWTASADGMTIDAELITGTTQAVQNVALAIAPATGSKGMIHVATASVLTGGIFKINGWGNDPEDSPNAYKYSTENTAGTVTQVSLDELQDTEFFVGVRTADGFLKISTWHWADGGGNSVYVLHGDCRVFYAHFQEGSVNTNVLYPGAFVAAGQILGRMGNSGSSGAPHTHINADRIYPITSIDDMIAKEAAGTLPLIGPRPMPFSRARAMKLSLIVPGGEGNAANSFATLTGQGMYDEPLGIRPRLNTRYVERGTFYLQPTGRKEPLPTFPLSGGPFPQISPSLGTVPSGGRLYIRGGTYGETITFNSPMTVRRYDYYDASGSVLIGH